jgi:hypothetical protein
VCSPGILLVDVYFLDDLADLRLADLRLADLFLGFTLSRFGLAVSSLGVPSCSKKQRPVFYTVYFTGLPNTAPPAGSGEVVRRCNRNLPPTLTS